MSKFLVVTSSLCVLSVFLIACERVQPPLTSDFLGSKNNIETASIREATQLESEKVTVSTTTDAGKGAISSSESNTGSSVTGETESLCESSSLSLAPPLVHVEPALWLQDYLLEKGLSDEQIGLVYVDLESGQSSNHNENTVFKAASTIKVPMAMYTYDATVNGQVQLNQLLTYRSDSDFEGGAGSLQHIIREGDQYEMGTLLEKAIRESDNIATNMIFRFWREQPEGLSLSARMNQAYGLSYDGSASIRAGDMAAVLDRLYHNPGNNPLYGKLLEDMKNTTFNSYATQYLPGDSFAHKYGIYDGYTNDVGIVYGDRPYLFSIYGRDLTNPSMILGDIGGYLYRYSESLSSQNAQK